ncbi:hypothetical protein [Neisseria iguanae]|uniref:Uncharacterized protein n=1 Tax=Neisseria iguanae TaxID=90242 RepID=A0A2P7TYM5_9NEIS|nr:hypothetical protein [Neisseria iguanae]PSJ79753.1 hypothetical protein C7N83_10280 [Neisseria iguanae]
MNNALNAKLSKLVYGSVPDSTDYFAKAHPFDRLILLIRHIYHVLDGQHGLTQVTLRIHCGNKQGQIRLLSMPPDADSAVIRLKRWNIYQRIAEQVLDSSRISVLLAHVKKEGDTKQVYCEDIVQQMINGFGLAAAESDRAPQLTGNQYPEYLNEPSAHPKQDVRNIISHRGKSLSLINTQPKTENYATAWTQSSKAAPIRVSRFSFGGYKQK